MGDISKHFSRREFALYHIHRTGMSVDEGYIGVTNNPSGRWAAHKRDCRKGNHHSVHLQRAFDKYNDLEFRVLVIGSKDYILSMEKHLRPEKNIGYNHAVGGDLPPSNKGIPMSEAQKEKIRASNIGKTNSAEHKRKSVETRKLRCSYKYGADNHLSKRVAQIDIQTNKVIAEFESTRKVIDLGYSQGNVAMVCRGERNKAYGYYWRFI